MTVQIIEIDGKKMAVLPEAEYRQLAEIAENLADSELAIRAEERRLAGEEYVPHEFMARLVEGEHPLKVWREYRGLTQQALGDMTALSKMTISSLETRKRDTTARNWRKLAEALSVEIEDILPLDN